jgi:hypothetical protein
MCAPHRVIDDSLLERKRRLIAWKAHTNKADGSQTHLSEGEDGDRIGDSCTEACVSKAMIFKCD